MPSIAPILMIEHDRALAGSLAGVLRQEGYVVSVVSEAQAGLAAAEAATPALVLLDWHLPEPGGMAVLEALREETLLAEVPVAVLSANPGDAEEVLALLAGADEYFPVPPRMAVFKARVAALLRRGRQSAPPEKGEILIAGPVRVDCQRHRAEVAGEAIGLTRTEFKILVTLIEGRGRVYDRNELIDRVLGNDAIVTDRTIDVHVTSLRKKLGDARWLVETVRGVGYRLSEGS